MLRVRLLLALVVLAAPVGCGSDTGAREEPPAADDVSAELEITFWPQGRSSASSQSWTLTCDPAGGTHRSPAEACAQLAALDNPFAPPPPDEICTEQYGGPEEALVEGTYRGEPVSYALSRTNGCHIARFERLRFLLPGGGGA